MKSTELRIGNLFQDQNGNLLEVAELTEDNQVFKVVDRSKFPLPDGWQSEPIHITEEWLERLGFVVGSLKRWTTKYYMFHSFWYINFKRDGFCSFIAFDCFLKEAQYVHQLQNLYFALTGEELTLKP